MPGKITANLVFIYLSTDVARKLLASVEPDNGGYIHSFVEANNLISKAEEKNILANFKFCRNMNNTFLFL